MPTEHSTPAMPACARKFIIETVDFIVDLDSLLIYLHNIVQYLRRENWTAVDIYGGFHIRRQEKLVHIFLLYLTTSIENV
ncbi:hypothetical protein N7462_003855 [Penicillium macrosclerotiorum]|uniref:uncharacterized protein n=1 Tax=Penicillium macrosclerotiorum TaxID=303699 RepID=UPI002547D110|nr:uncharacterized protein N7462_003855 [Penicillium macrosclerotiorum]KAJ5689463.1 hypothetical protein N7462_003855 [Penicillium macrosclerotiorum]